MNSKLPLAIEIEINSECNLSCTYCPNSKSERLEKGHMGVDLFRQIMSQLKELKYTGRISYHFYNEPTLSPNLELFIEMTKFYIPDAQPVLYSNGLNLTQEKIQNLYSLGLKKLILTEHAKTNLDHLKNDSSSLIEKDKFFKLGSFKDLPFTNRSGTVSVGKKLTEPLKTPCFIPWCVMVITVKGHVLACYEDFNQKHVMGRIGDKSLLDIWNSEQYVKFREDLKKGLRSTYSACSQCNNQMIII